MKQRHWVLLRHAHAEATSPNGDDADRPLSLRGLSEAKAVAAWLRTELKGRTPRLLSSPATRALATAQAVAEALGIAVRPEPKIYDATPGELLAILNDLGSDGVTVLIGHNPGIEQVVALLAEGRSDEYRGMPTASVAWFTVPDGLVEPGAAPLHSYWSP